ncbi:MAG TPA: MOSC domain-containing protein [bacterium]|nr:MOSC domain-containing protein [bacterium]
MRIESVNVSLPRGAAWNGGRVTTGIFKDAVGGPVMLRRLNLDGDRQADLRVHGGPSKAVYAYGLDHYAYWRRELSGTALPYGMFGENLTADWPGEDTVNVGDRFRVGSAEVMVTEPRLPCYKLGLKFGRKDIIKRFLASGRTGFYLAVVREGTVERGDAIELLERDTRGVTVADITRLYAHDKANRDLLRRALELSALSDSWRAYFQDRLDRLAGTDPDRR